MLQPLSLWLFETLAPSIPTPCKTSNLVEDRSSPARTREEKNDTVNAFLYMMHAYGTPIHTVVSNARKENELKTRPMTLRPSRIRREVNPLQNTHDQNNATFSVHL